MRKSKKISGFTLAEVLLTLVIVGIIASITISTLLNNVKNLETVNKLKSTYSILSQATTQLRTDCGDSFQMCLNPNTADNNSTVMQQVYELYLSKLQTIKQCGSGAGCFSSDQYIALSGADNFFLTYAKRYFLLSNGAAVGIDWDGNGGPTTYLFKLYVDLNGEKKPNQIGRDTFAFGYNKTKFNLIPFSGTCDLSQIGTACTEKILIENAVNY